MNILNNIDMRNAKTLKIIFVLLFISMNSIIIKAQITMDISLLKTVSIDTVPNRCFDCLGFTYPDDIRKKDFERIPILIRSKILFDKIINDDPTEQQTEYKSIEWEVDSSRFSINGEYYYTLCIAKPWDKKINNRFRFDAKPIFHLRLIGGNNIDTTILLRANDWFNNFMQEYVYIVIKNKPGEREGQGRLRIRKKMDSWCSNAKVHLESNQIDTTLHKNITDIWLPKGVYTWSVHNIKTDIPNQSLHSEGKNIVIKENSDKNDYYSFDIDSLVNSAIKTLKIINKTKFNYSISVKKDDNIFHYQDGLYKEYALRILKDNFSLIIEREGYNASKQILFNDNLECFFGKQITHKIKVDTVLIKGQEIFGELKSTEYYPPGKYNLLLQKKNCISQETFITIPFDGNNYPYKLEKNIENIKWKFNHSRQWAITFGVTFCLSAMATITSFVIAEVEYNNYKSSTNTSEATRLHKSVKKWRNATYICGGVTIAAVIPFACFLKADKKFNKMNNEIINGFKNNKL
jgi:hypothetical protein